MKLLFLKGDACPVCGEKTVVEESVEHDVNEKIREHAHGGRWEYRKFLCGQGIAFSPNSNRTELKSYQVCKNNEAYIQKEKNRKIAKQSVLEFILALTDVDKEYKETLLDAITYK